jgi:DNA polymerase III sliding clamp (beta) subunit (PCNA family)
MKIETNVLKGLIEFAGNNDTRYYLNGIYIKQDGMNIRMIASDGHTLATSTLEDDTWEGDDNIEVIIPIETVKAIKTKREHVWLEKQATDNAYILTDHVGMGLLFQGIEGRYPDAERVWPNCEPDGKAGLFNPEYVAKIGKCAKTQKEKPHNTAFWYHQERELIFAIGKIRGVIMAYRGDHGYSSMPAF